MILKNRNGKWCDVCINRVVELPNGQFRYLKRRRVRATGRITIPGAEIPVSVCTKCHRRIIEHIGRCNVAVIRWHLMTKLLLTSCR